MHETLFVKLHTPCVELSRDIADHSPEIFRDSSTALGMTKGDCRVAGFFGAPSSKRGWIRTYAWRPVGAWHKRLYNLEEKCDTLSGTNREIVRRRTPGRSRNENHRRSFFGRGDRP